jgi:hypothetical protein
MITDVVGEERPSGLRRWRVPLREQPGDGALEVWRRRGKEPHEVCAWIAQTARRVRHRKN